MLSHYHASMKLSVQAWWPGTPAPQGSGGVLMHV